MHSHKWISLLQNCVHIAWAELFQLLSIPRKEGKEGGYTLLLLLNKCVWGEMLLDYSSGLEF